MVALWVIIGVIAGLLLVAGLYDRRTRSRRRTLRDSTDTSIADREIRRDERATRFGATPDMDTWKRNDRP